MKERLKSWVTSIIGIILMVFATSIIIYGYFEGAIDWKTSSITGGVGLLLLFAKDSLIEYLKKRLTSK